MTPLVLRWPAAASSSPAPPSSSACQLQLHHRLHPTRLQGERSWLCTELATAPAKAAQKGCSAQLQTCLQALHLTSPKALPCLLQPGSHPAGLHIFSSIVFSHGYNSSTAGPVATPRTFASVLQLLLATSLAPWLHPLPAPVLALLQPSPLHTRNTTPTI